jgi:anti-sigma B factor antagonist
MEGIQVSVEKVGRSQQISVIKVGGYIDTTTSAELEHSLSSILKSSNYYIIIDLGNVDYISSAGWGIFISEIKGIREKNGDLKLVRMIPDVYEVFELLEFHYILKAFDTIEDAVSDFEQNSSSTSHLKSAVAPQAASQQPSAVVAAQPDNNKVQVAEASGNQTPQLDTLADKLRQVIIEMPDAGTFQIIKSLNTPRFGNVKIGWFELRKQLKALELDSKKKRIAYFKQKTFG